MKQENKLLNISFKKEFYKQAVSLTTGVPPELSSNPVPHRRWPLDESDFELDWLGHEISPIPWHQQAERRF